MKSNTHIPSPGQGNHPTNQPIELKDQQLHQIVGSGGCPDDIGNPPYHPARCAVH